MTDLRLRCGFDYDCGECGVRTSRVMQSAGGRLVPCCPRHEVPGAARDLTCEDLETLAVQEVIES